MKLITLTFILTLLTFPTIASSHPLTFQCIGESDSIGKNVNIFIEVSTPDELDRLSITTTLGGEEMEIYDSSPVGIGNIQITERIEKQEFTRRHKLIVTRMPSKDNSLIGYYTANSFVYMIRIDPWKNEFTYYDSFNDEPIRGKIK